MVHSVAIIVRAGLPIDAECLHTGTRGDRRAMMDVLGHAIAMLLPEEYRGVYRHTGGTA